MKLNTLDHPKTFDLCDRLDVDLPQALGLLVLLWAFTARKAPRGDVGKWTDGAIARACHWRGDSAQFIQALVDSGFIDTHPEHRLVVHDWHEHAERWVRASLKKMGQNFVTGSTAEATAEDSTEATDDHSPCPDLSCPDQTSSPSEKARKRALPEDFTPTVDHFELAKTVGVDLEAEFEQFRDYHRAKGSTMKDWNAALRTWLRNAQKFGGRKPKGAANKQEALEQRNADIAERWANGGVQ